MAFWGRRDRESQERQHASDAQQAQRARSAIVAADERIRATGDELAFATAELGEDATAELRAGLDSVREHLGEAFQLHQLNHDHIPDTPDEVRTRNARILQLCEWAESVLDERTAALQARVERARRAPEMVQRVRADAAALRERVPDAQRAAARLAERYSPSALQRVRLHSEDVEQLLDFAEHSADLSDRRRAAGALADANLALETATETVRRAASILDGVDSFEIEALRAQNTLADVIDDSRSDIAAARTEPRNASVDDAIERLEAALAEVSAGRQRDPFADLSLVSSANAALDAARARAARPVPSEAQVQHGIAAADHAIGIAASLIEGHRGWIGADARTRLAEARRHRSEIAALPMTEDSREQVLQRARRASELADESLRLAQRDIDSSRPDDDDWGWGGGGGGGPWGGGGRGRGGVGGGGGGVLGPVIGGVLLGGLLGDMFD
ncbi:hypothetical protein [Leucobacter chromiiresistens]|uniref:Uncharacterized protein n=1 Tax=Leucobacter chromiiresistens TaxID=1079994 RepID=A0A1H0YRM1_9MICO|nr:hypothetical protein [Leucobacter chromiiresistens]SDQ17867.1 hypothetical protein SAMN04488565_1133 [Leucobacter chromiiresistens]